MNKEIIEKTIKVADVQFVISVERCTEMQSEWVRVPGTQRDEHVCYSLTGRNPHVGSALLITDQISADIRKGKTEGVARVYDSAWYYFQGDNERAFIPGGTEVKWRLAPKPVFALKSEVAFV